MSMVMRDKFDITAPHTIVLKAIGSNFVINVDNVEVMQYSDSTYTSGYVGLRSWAVSNNKFHDIKFVDATPIKLPTPKTILNFGYAYLYGYEMGKVGAEDSVKREEASAILYRILKQDSKIGDFVAPANATFSDVLKERWSFSAIEYMTSINVFDKTSGKVRPGVEITRGEASKIIAYSMGLQPDPSKTINFTDLSENNKYYDSIKSLVDIGVLKGYSNNTIKPDGLLTRAEYITMINRLIGRDDSYDKDNQINLYPDIDQNHWAYKDIVRTSLGFSEDGTGKYKVDPLKKLKRSQIDYN